MKRTMTTLVAISAVLASGLLLAARSDDDDRKAIEAAVLDYIEGWYEGDETRMERAVHPQLAKRLVQKDKDDAIMELTAERLVAATSRRTPLSEDAPQVKEIEIFDVEGDIATAKLTSNDFYDYFHLARFEEGWRIVNVLWDWTEKR